MGGEALHLRYFRAVSPWDFPICKWNYSDNMQVTFSHIALVTEMRVTGKWWSSGRQRNG
jgi:hypothetical protein